EAASSSDADGKEVGSSGEGNRATGGKWRRPSLAQQRARRAQLPPAFDVVHWNDEDISRGHLLRVLHRDTFVVLDYHRQARMLTEEGNKAERVVSVMLPAVYTARFLAVLEGRSEKVEVHSRYTNATFTPNPAAPYTFTLKCTSTRPAQQKQQVAGEEGDETFEWTVEFDVAESLMLQRFLTQALHYNTGFARTSV
nr:Chain A, mitochondrial RNA-binding protein 2 [Trypanosoma brucei brucei TREU927]2GIA_G Chain G, mitochondrial RNA-binding protein 2 [Trypanosoma brucei brucei TREU927]